MTTSEATYWIRPYFSQYKKRQLLRPCGHSLSYQDIPTERTSLSTNSDQQSRKDLPNKFDILPLSSQNESDSLSSYIISINLPTGDCIHLPLPQKHRSTTTTKPLIHNNRVRLMKPNGLSHQDESQLMNNINCLPSSHLY